MTWEGFTSLTSLLEALATLASIGLTITLLIWKGPDLLKRLKRGDFGVSFGSLNWELRDDPSVIDEERPSAPVSERRQLSERPHGGAPPTIKPLNILWIDDEPGCRWREIERLRRSGHRIRLQTEPHLLTIFRGARFDLVVVRMVMKTNGVVDVGAGLKLALELKKLGIPAAIWATDTEIKSVPRETAQAAVLCITSSFDELERDIALHFSRQAA